jgi:hypothetical protein
MAQRDARGHSVQHVDDQIYPEGADQLASVGSEGIPRFVQPGVVRSATMGVETRCLKPELVGSNGAFCHVGGRQSSEDRACCLLLGSRP